MGKKLKEIKLDKKVLDQDILIGRVRKKEISKGWGSEIIWANQPEYCGKFLVFDAGKKMSMHFHKDKIETWYVLEGQLILRKIQTKDAFSYERNINVGDVIHNNPLEPHQLEAITDAVVLEISTRDSVEDNYRIIPGDSQK